MKKSFLLFALCLFTINSFASLDEESSYESLRISYTVNNTNGSVFVNFELPDVSTFQEIILFKSAHPYQDFKKVKQLTKEDILKLNDENVIEDENPTENVEAYYKIQTIDQYGVLRIFPSVKL